MIFVRTTIGLLAAAALAVAFVGQTAAAAVTAAPRVMAHKGLHYPYSPAPENSVGAILKAAARHVPIEIDILLSKPTTAHPNGVPFVFHDTTLDRMTKLRGSVWDHTPDQLAHACLVTVPGRNTCSKYTIPRLTTVLARARAAGGTLDIEIKNETLTWTQAATIVQRLEWTDAWTWDTMPGFQDPMILSAWAQPLAQVRKVAAHRDDPPILTEFLTVHPDYTAENTTGSVMEAVYFRNVTAQAVAQLHGMGLAVDSFTANRSDAWQALASAGVDWVIVDDVAGYQKWAAAPPG